jgi:hypothetical protein
MTPEMQREYTNYINSARWRNIRTLMIKQAGGKCASCGAAGTPSKPLEVHHKTYERLGRESMSDLDVLCRPCHEIADAKRAQDGKARSDRALSNAIYNNGCDTFMTKKYGEDWQLYHDPNEFDDWLYKKEQEESAGYFRDENYGYDSSW